MYTTSICTCTYTHINNIIPRTLFPAIHFSYFKEME